MGSRLSRFRCRLAVIDLEEDIVNCHRIALGCSTQLTIELCKMRHEVEFVSLGSLGGQSGKAFLK
jgi:hypothetical protein